MYCDTDSVIYRHILGEYNPPLSEFVGGLTPSWEVVTLQSMYPMVKLIPWRSGKRPRLRARRVKVRFSLRAIVLSLENLNVIIRAIN